LPGKIKEEEEHKVAYSFSSHVIWKAGQEIPEER
jgi:hypothetical protein